MQFSSPTLPYLFLAPQLAVIFIFFYWPSVQAMQSSFYLEDPFGFGSTFVGFANYSDALKSGAISRHRPLHRRLHRCWSPSSRWRSAFVLAVKADASSAAAAAYKTLLISVYAIAPPVAGLIGMMFFDQHIGPLRRRLPASSAGT